VLSRLQHYRYRNTIHVLRDDLIFSKIWKVILIRGSELSFNGPKSYKIDRIFSSVSRALIPAAESKQSFLNISYVVFPKFSVQPIRVLPKAQVKKKKKEKKEKKKKKKKKKKKEARFHKQF